jgi:hypothetical protein
MPDSFRIMQWPTMNRLCEGSEIIMNRCTVSGAPNLKIAIVGRCSFFAGLSLNSEMDLLPFKEVMTLAARGSVGNQGHRVRMVSKG